MPELVAAAFAFLGAVVGAVLTAELRADADRDERRWRYEMEALAELGELLSQLRAFPTQPAEWTAREITKVRIASLTFAVRDDRPRQATEPLLAMQDGSQEQNDQIGNAVRIVGATRVDLGNEKPKAWWARITGR